MPCAAIYLRASTEGQNYSTDNQLHVLTQYADAHDLTIVRTYIDEGRSGLTLPGRPGLRQLLADALAPSPGFESLLVYDISRWGRFQDPDESAHYEFICRRAGIKVTYCAEAFDNDGSAMANIFKALKRQAAGDYSRELSAKVALGKRRLAERGYRQGGRRGFGFVRLLVDEQGQPRGVLEAGEQKCIQSDRVLCRPGPLHERRLVRRIFHMFTVDRLGETRSPRP